GVHHRRPVRGPAGLPLAPALRLRAGARVGSPPPRECPVPSPREGTTLRPTDRGLCRERPPRRPACESLPRHTRDGLRAVSYRGNRPPGPRPPPAPFPLHAAAAPAPDPRPAPNFIPYHRCCRSFAGRCPSPPARSRGLSWVRG